MGVRGEVDVVWMVRGLSDGDGWRSCVVWDVCWSAAIAATATIATGVVKVMGWWIGTRSKLADVGGIIVIVIVIVVVVVVVNVYGSRGV